MGTNYDFLPGPPCKHCGRSGRAKHIGKSSAGNPFYLHVYPDDGINTFADWQRVWARTDAGARIEDEYGRDVSFFDMCKIINGDKGWEPIDGDFS